MDENITLIIRELSEKLGTTAEHLWGVLVRQAPISAITDLLVMMVWGAALVWAFKVVQRKTTPQGESSRPEWKDEGKFFAWGALVVFAVILVLIAGCTISQVSSALFNPEYWALRQLM